MTWMLLTFGVGLAQTPGPSVDSVETSAPKATEWEFRASLDGGKGAGEKMAIAQSIRLVEDLATNERHGFLSVQCSSDGAVFAVAVPGLVRARQSRDVERLIKPVKVKVQVANDVWDLRVFPFETLDGWAVSAAESKKLIDAMYETPKAVVTVKTPMRKGENIIQFQPNSMVELGQLWCLRPDE